MRLKSDIGFVSIPSHLDPLVRSLVPRAYYMYLVLENGAPFLRKAPLAGLRRNRALKHIGIATIGVDEFSLPKIASVKAKKPTFAFSSYLKNAKVIKYKS